MSHQLISGIPGSGLTRTSKVLAGEAVERGEMVIVAVRGEHRRQEWSIVSGATVTTDAAGVLTMVRALITERYARTEAPLTLILDDVSLTETTWSAVESIVRLGRRARVTLVLATTRDVPLRVKDCMEGIVLAASERVSAA